MQLQDRSGIQCDLCASVHQQQFKYYSIDITECDYRQTSVHKSKNIILSYDACPLCYDKYCALVIKNYKPVSSGIVCDLTGKRLTGTFKSYYATIHKATVNIPAVTVDKKHLELSICAEAFEDIKSKIKTAQSSNWTTKQ